MPDPIRRPATAPQTSAQWAALGAYLAREAATIAAAPATLHVQLATAVRALHHLALRHDVDWELLVKMASTQVHYDLNVTEAENA